MEYWSQDPISGIDLLRNGCTDVVVAWGRNHKNCQEIYIVFDRKYSIKYNIYSQDLEVLLDLMKELHLLNQVKDVEIVTQWLRERIRLNLNG